MKIKGYLSTRSSLIKAVVFLILLAILDAIFSDFGIRNNHIEEANPLMRFVYETSIFSFYLLKIGLPCLLLYFLLNLEPKLYLRLLIGFSLLLYFTVLLQHIFWMSFVL